MFLLIVFLPFLGSFLGVFCGRLLSPQGVVAITTNCILITFFLSIFLFFEIAFSGVPCYLKIIYWINSELFNVHWGFLFDSLTVILLVVVTLISALVHMYSTEYMSHDPHVIRFISYLSLFTAFMFVLISADNLVQMFLGWEGIGLASYLLINFWFTRLQANKSAIKAIMLNRIGDFGLAFGTFMVYTFFQSLEYGSIFPMVPFFIEQGSTFLAAQFNVLNAMGILFFIGSIGKSAQIGLHAWLPDAMEGPTPVSALIHAATLVTAGIFLIARCSHFFEYASSILSFITLLGSSTAFFATTIGLVQNDFKKVIAFSTCSQLGYMVFACSLSKYSVGVFHLANHAFFKALLFLSVGSVIHSIGDEQDMRKMGGLRKIIPYTYTMICIGSFSLMGMPYLTGFYSKDVVLEVAYSKFTISGHFAFWLGAVCAFFTAFYSVRLAFLTFLEEPNKYKTHITNAQESPFKMSFALAILAILSIFIGFLFKDMTIGLGSDFWWRQVNYVGSSFLIFNWYEGKSLY
jgi:proton-translocating NADH-quinone oxidoreductase chain L